MSDYTLNFIGKAFTAFSGLVVSVALARYFGVALRGEYAFIVQASSTLAIVLGVGVNQTFPYFFRKNPSGETFRMFAQFFVAQFGVYAAVGLVLSLTLRSQTSVSFILLIVSTVLYQQMESAMTAYRIRLKIWTNIVASAFRAMAHLGLLLFFPVHLFWPAAVSAGVWLSMSVVYLVQTRIVPQSRPTLTFAREVVAFSWLPMLSALLLVLNYNVDTLMLKWLGSATDLGNYAVAAGIVLYIWMIPDAIKEVMVSRLVRAQGASVIVFPLKVAILAGLAGLLAVASTGSWLIPIFFGEEFQDAYALCTILSIGVVSMIYFKLLGTYLLALGRRGFYFSVLFFAVVLNVVSNLLVIPNFGAVGASWSCVLSYSVTGIAFIVYFKRFSGLPWGDLLWFRGREIRRIGNLVSRGQHD